jgi:hypothetical protein
MRNASTAIALALLVAATAPPSVFESSAWPRRAVGPRNRSKGEKRAQRRAWAISMEAACR